MPLAKIEYGPNAGSRECILEKWIVDPSGISGSYTSDPLENCIKCNFYDSNNKKHPLQDEEACRCPEWMNWGIYDYVRDFFADNGDGKKNTFHKIIDTLSQRGLNNLKKIKKSNLNKIIIELVNCKSNIKKFVFSAAANFSCESDKIVKEVIEGKIDYNNLPYDEENEVRKGYYFKELAEFIKRNEGMGKGAMCHATKKECLRENCRLYAFPKDGAAKGWVCREYKIYFLQKCQIHN